VIHIPVDDEGDDDDGDDDDTTNITKSPELVEEADSRSHGSVNRFQNVTLPYKSMVWALPPSSISRWKGQQWMKTCRPLSGPPRLPSRTEAAKLLASKKASEALTYRTASVAIPL
jgi:hypothetical protein